MLESVQSGLSVNRNTFQNFFSHFVEHFGGEVLPEVHTVPYADFLFRNDLIVSELKTLEEDKTADHAKKLQALAWDWNRRGLIRAFGRELLGVRQDLISRSPSADHIGADCMSPHTARRSF
jgi:hypothetical protein